MNPALVLQILSTINTTAPIAISTVQTIIALLNRERQPDEQITFDEVRQKYEQALLLTDGIANTAKDELSRLTPADPLTEE